MEKDGKNPVSDQIILNKMTTDLVPKGQDMSVSWMKFKHKTTDVDQSNAPATSPKNRSQLTYLKKTVAFPSVCIKILVSHSKGI